MLIGIPGFLVKAHASICLAREIKILWAISELWPVLVEQNPCLPMPVEEHQQESKFDCRVISSICKIECPGKSGSSLLIALAYLSLPGPLDRDQKAFYAVAPLPSDWTNDQVASFLREYNLYSIQSLTIHEAVPGHYLRLALSYRHPSALRSALWSGPFVEGWAVYAERVMIDEGYLDHDPLMRLISRKMYLRSITNAIIDSAIHVDGMTHEEAMKLMIEGGFQEDREAAGKWVRAQLSSAQLSTYFVGYQEHEALRADVEAAWGDEFTLRHYHDQVLSYGSPPVSLFAP